jgi:hypothetical protein
MLALIDSLSGFLTAVFPPLVLLCLWRLRRELADGGRRWTDIAAILAIARVLDKHGMTAPEARDLIKRIGGDGEKMNRAAEDSEKDWK